MLTTDQKGAVAELAIARAAAELGLGVFKPLTDNQNRGINWAEDFVLDARLRALLGP